MVRPGTCPLAAACFTSIDYYLFWQKSIVIDLGLLQPLLLLLLSVLHQEDARCTLKCKRLSGKNASKILSSCRCPQHACCERDQHAETASTGTPSHPATALSTFIHIRRVVNVATRATTTAVGHATASTRIRYKYFFGRGKWRSLRQVHTHTYTYNIYTIVQYI